MESRLFPRFEPVIRSLDLDLIERARHLPDSLLLAKDGRLASYYAPVDWTNTDARLVIVGITPGFSQSMLALRTAQDLLRQRSAASDVPRAAKRTAAFGGDMRANLVALLDHFGLQQWLRITSCSELFTTRTDLLHTTSVLRFPTFLDGGNYNGAPNMIRTASLRAILIEHFAQEVQHLPHAAFLPLGPKVAEVMEWLAKEGKLDPARVIAGMPHPSGANGERISYVLGRKPRHLLSAKVDANRMDRAVENLRARINSLQRAVPA